MKDQLKFKPLTGNNNKILITSEKKQISHYDYSTYSLYQTLPDVMRLGDSNNTAWTAKGKTQEQNKTKNNKNKTTKAPNQRIKVDSNFHQLCNILCYLCE